MSVLHSNVCPAGHLYPVEAHLVSVIPQSALPACPPEGCVVVTAVMFELSDDLTSGSSWLEPLFAAMPLNEGVSGVLCARQSLCGSAPVSFVPQWHVPITAACGHDGY